MTGTQIWTVSRIGAAGGRASAANGRNSRSRRAGTRLWTLLNAQALARGPDGVASIEDDRWRMAARRAN
jgi:hypothetical protein